MIAALGFIAAACASSIRAEPTAPAQAATNCGEEIGQFGAPADGDGRQCLLDAFIAGRQAVFVVRTTTTEGDPIVRTYRTHGSAPVEIIHDARRDAFGSGQIELFACGRLVPIDDWNAVTGGQTPKEHIFVEDGCEQVGTR